MLLLGLLASLASTSGRKNQNAQQYLHVIDPKESDPGKREEIVLDSQPKELDWSVPEISARLSMINPISWRVIC